MAWEIYDTLPDDPSVTAVSTDSIHRQNGPTVKVSERQLFDDLLAFCATCQSVSHNYEGKKDDYGYASHMQNIETFLDTMVYLSGDMFNEAVEGLAERHTKWLSQDEERKLIFVTPKNRLSKSQAMVTDSISTSIDESCQHQVSQSMTGDINVADLDAKTKLVLSDDWAISGNHIGNDLGMLLQKLAVLDGVTWEQVDIEINLLLARKDQVENGIHKFEDMKTYFPELNSKMPQVVSYFETSIDKPGFSVVASPTGSHSSADYGFSTTLETMYLAAKPYTTTLNRLPYIATIVPEYRRKD